MSQFPFSSYTFSRHQRVLSYEIRPVSLNPATQFDFPTRSRLSLASPKVLSAASQYLRPFSQFKQAMNSHLYISETKSVRTRPSECPTFVRITITIAIAFLDGRKSFFVCGFQSCRKLKIRRCRLTLALNIFLE